MTEIAEKEPKILNEEEYVLTPNMVKGFVEEAIMLLGEAETALLRLEVDITDEEQIKTAFRAFHSLKGNAGFYGYAEIERLCHAIEGVIEEFKVENIAIEIVYVYLAKLIAMIDILVQSISDLTIESKGEIIDFKEHLLDLEDIKNTLAEKNKEKALPGKADKEQIVIDLDKAKEDPLVQSVLQGVTEEAKKHQPTGSEMALKEEELDALLVSNEPKPIEAKKQSESTFDYTKATVVNKEQASKVEVSDVAREVLEKIQQENKKNEQKSKNKEIKIELEEAQDLVIQENTMPKTSSILKLKEEFDKKGNQKNSSSAQVIRVETEKIDKLLDLVGELVIAEAMVLQRSNLQKILAGKVDKSVTHLKKITRDIQDISMSMRMVPLSATFQKMVRVVRDLSVKSGKKVNLNIIGEETEVDKSITEQISDPLLHIIRNAMDHGIGSKEERLKEGKEEEGQIRLEARHVAGEVWIIIKDDGKGLNRDKIFQKALERGLVKEPNREYSDQEIYKFIFEAGFSTAEKVTEISGRGVGMDVVYRQIENLRGKIEVKSEQEKGTTIILKIPLTLAIIEGMMAATGGSFYTVPITSIRECFQPKQKQIVMTPEGLEFVNIRGELLPIVRLYEIYRLKPKKTLLCEGILIVVESDKGKYCLFVDEILGQNQIVIKPLPEYLGEIKGVSGMAIMGSGEVSMILDVSVLIRSVESLLK